MTILEADRLVANIYAIRREVRSSLALLESKEAEMLEAEELLCATGLRMNDLKHTLEQLEMENAEVHRLIEEKRWEKVRIDAEIKHVRELCEVFRRRNNELRYTDVQELSPEMHCSVLEKLDEVLCAISSEFVQGSDSGFEQLRKIAEQEETIDREIHVLSEIQCEDWRPCDPMRVYLQDLCLRHPDSTIDSHVNLSSLESPKSLHQLQVLQKSVQPSLPSPPIVSELKNAVSNLAKVVKIRHSANAKIYEGQHHFFERLVNRISANLENYNMATFERQLNEKLRKLREISAIEPLVIPSVDSLRSDPAEIISEHLSQICEILQQNRQNAHLAERLEQSAGNSLRIPEFEMPAVPKHIKNPIFSPQLTELSEQLRKLKNLSSVFVPLSTIQSLAACHRAALSVQPPDIECVVQTQIPRPLRFEENSLRDSTIAEFEELAKSRLPPALAKRLDAEHLRFAPTRIDEADVEDEKNCEETFEPFESGIEERGAIVNSLLRSMTAMEIPQLHRVVPPAVREMEPEESLDVEPILEIVDELLKPERQMASFLIDEIRELEGRLAELERKSSAFHEEEEVGENEVMKLRRQISELKRKEEEGEGLYQLEITEIKSLNARKEEIQKHNMELQQELEKGEHIEEEWRNLEKALTEKREFLRQKKQAFEEEQALRMMLRSGMMKVESREDE
jgi:hypothetical protein